MKIHFFFYELKSAYGHPPSLRRGSMAIEADPERSARFNKNLLSAIDTDMSENRHGHVDLVLSNIESVEQGRLETFAWEGQGFIHDVTSTRVRFEHAIFNECPEWPIWCCTLAQYRAALQGYRRFLDMPESLNSELTIELPDGEPEDCH